MSTNRGKPGAQPPRVAGHDGRGLPPGYHDAALRPPHPWEMVRELRIVPELVDGLLRTSSVARRVPRGRGETVMVVPGIGATDRWTKRLRGFLDGIGYRSAGWEQGRNDGNVARLLPPLLDRTACLVEATCGPVRLVGWSLGGYLCREVARERPQLVEQVITLGSPVVGGPSYTASAPAYRRRGWDLSRLREMVLEREQTPITVPIHSVYSRWDAVVDWRACVDTFRNPRVEHHEIATSHLGLIVAPAAFELVARLLARTPRT